MSSEVPPAESPSAAVLDDSWHRVHPLSPLVRAGRQIVSLIVVLAGVFLLNQHGGGSDLVTELVVIAVVLAGGFVSWLVTRWQIAGGVLRIDGGLIRRNSQRFPLSQIQAVDIAQTGLARVLGLAELQLRMAGGGSASGRLACLPVAEAEDLRRRLLALSARPAAPVAGTPVAGMPVAGMPVAGIAGAGAAPSGRLLFRVRSSRLPVAVAFSRSGAIVAAVLIATGVTVAVTGSVSTITPYLPVIFGIVVSLWRQYNGEYATTVIAAADGLRLSSGLVQTTAETIRPGRIQAVRLVQPLVWRLPGWCRVEVDIAGHRQRGEDRAEGQRLRALIPVGTAADATAMIAELLPGHPAPSQRSPGIARWKAPLSYHFLAYGADERYVVASRGRIRKATTWVPLEKVQSIRWAQGPVQRLLGIASVRLDVAGRRVTLAIEDRSAAEAAAIFGRLPDQARAARQGVR